MQPELVDTGTLRRDCEALLFVASESLSIKQLAKLTGAEESAVSVALQQIDQEFEHRGIVLREIAERRIDQTMIDQIDTAERERAEREALEWAAAEVDDDLSKGGDD